MSTQALGAVKTKTDTSLGSFQFRWSTIWGVWAPPGFQPGLLLHLIDKGYTVKALGHTIQAQTDPERPELLEEIRMEIKAYALGDWNVSG